MEKRSGEKKRATNAQMRWAFSAKRKPAPKSNPRPGTRISKPVFGCELFVAQTQDAEARRFGKSKLFTKSRTGRKVWIVGEAKAVVVGMTSNGFTLADPDDRGMLDVVGFDATVPALIADFIRQ